jgi:hypothetical protein
LKAIADLAIGKMRAKREELTEALNGKVRSTTPSWPV